MVITALLPRYSPARPFLGEEDGGGLPFMMDDGQNRSQMAAEATHRDTMRTEGKLVHAARPEVQ